MVEYLSGDHIIHKLASPNFTENRILPYSLNPSLKPKFHIKKDERGVVLHFEKNQADSIKIFTKRTSEDKFEFLAEISESHYLDTRPNTFNVPEIREYMASFVKNNMQMGQSSDIVLIIKK